MDEIASFIIAFKMILYGVMNLTKCKSIYFNDTCTWNDLYFCTFVPPNEWIMEKDYFSHILPNGLRIVHLPSASPVSYCGFAVNAGTRDEEMDEFGLAHFVEHMIFKGTEKRKSWHILNRMENVGGELNAYTTKEETFVYSIFMEEHFRRAFELLSDLVFHSQFPEQEIEKEVDVILDEINSYEDSPSELIFDEFENLLFDGHALGHNILGDEQSLLGFGSESGKSFMRRFYAPENMVFFSMGRIPFKKIVQMAESTLSDIAFPMAARNRTAPGELLPVSRQIHKDTHQAHVLIGGRAYSMHDEKRLPLFLLNNLLGGPGMNNRLNVSLREKNGLVYNVESNVTSYTDTGLASIYFGTDPKNKEKAIRLVYKELAKLREVKLTATQLAAAKKQVIGQLGVSGDNREGLFLGLGKSFLHYNRYDTLLICTCTAFIILFSGAPLDGSVNGVQLTQHALTLEVGKAGGIFVAVAIFLFAFSSIIGNYYYGEANIRFITPKKSVLYIYRLAVGGMVMFGALASLELAWSLADITMAFMTICNLFAISLLSKQAFLLLHDYISQKRSGIKSPVFDKNKLPELKDKAECW